ncbi:hypothetical protein [Sphingobacterium sp. DR205]|uniref:hypothetical protein n=1 Tax=Sphingobacterium sp. DR205 TaxID=2713573 RepID=UPI0013E4B98A|nr:hypothetical protein [Sphingobacterium sp. DR205]QIH31619.1 hypothetical protein G6053_01275 [Sphingobacterium sp. DR205]
MPLQLEMLAKCKGGIVRLNLHGGSISQSIFTDCTEKWILVHTEIEGGNDAGFLHRIFQYHYRLLDRYRVPVETIAIFTGDRGQRRPAVYGYSMFRTSLEFRYLSYQIFDHSEEELLVMDNIFAYIVLACQKSLHIYCKPFPQGNGFLFGPPDISVF